MKTMQTWLAACVLAGGVLTGVAACSGTTTSGTGGGTLDASGDTAKVGDGTQADGLSDSATGGDSTGSQSDAVLDGTDSTLPDGFFDDPDTTSSGSDTGPVFNPDAACNSIAAEGKQAAASILFLLDYSWSMCMDPGAPLSQLNCATDSTKAKWSILVEAMKAAVPALPDNSFSGMAYYPDVVDANTVCKVASSPQVPLYATGPVGSPQRQSLISSLPALLTDNSPVASTPTGDALNAMYAYYQATPESDLPGATRYVVLITDGKPTCAGSPANAASAIIASVTKANVGANAVKTFVVGVPGSEGARATLSQAAQAGGTGTPGCSNSGPKYCHFDMTTAPSPADLAKNLAAALASIKGKVVSCDYEIPPNPKGGKTDYTYVNVRYTPSGGGAPQDLIYDPNCVGAGWHFDDPAAPKHILMCADTCAALEADTNPKLDVLFGCPRQEK